MYLIGVSDSLFQYWKSPRGEKREPRWCCRECCHASYNFRCAIFKVRAVFSYRFPVYDGRFKVASF